MWDVLELILNLLLELPLDFIDCTDFWRFSAAFFSSLALAGMIHWLGKSRADFISACLIVVGAAAGAYWEFRARRK